ncbi:MAG: hypothetical protein M1826_000822 [Phylliscum demangeonii]|nr:MAG: hypothetical protein M1826_000822 [Phylliscum demangeonii]
MVSATQGPTLIQAREDKIMEMSRLVRELEENKVADWALDTPQALLRGVLQVRGQAPSPTPKPKPKPEQRKAATSDRVLRW